VYICHFTAAVNNLYKTLCVSPSAVLAHLAHGDYVGYCDNATCDEYLPMAFKAAGVTDFLLYPNPANEEVYVGIEPFQGQPLTIRVLNSLGQVVRIVQIDEVQTEVEIIDTRMLSAGLYQVELTNDTFRAAKKFVLE
jgi:hypothetical protein